MELCGVDELMGLLHACRGVRRAARGDGLGLGAGTDVHDHALRTAALLRRGRPADKELQVAGLVHGIGVVLRPGGDQECGGDDGRDGSTPGGNAAADAADAVRALLGERVAALVRRSGPHDYPAPSASPADNDLLTLRQAVQEAGAPTNTAAGAGVLEDWRAVLELVSARNSRLHVGD